MKFDTGIEMTSKFGDILNSVIGQMSDGIWENTRSMEKYWKSLDYSCSTNNTIIIEDRYGVCANPVEFFANKIKQIIKIEIEDGNNRLEWDRACGEKPCYIHGGVTVGDCYELYELLKGRKTSGKVYASYEDFMVTLTYGGVSFNLTVRALNPSDAKRLAIAKFSSEVETKVTSV